MAYSSCRLSLTAYPHASAGQSPRSRKSGGRATAVIEEIIASKASKMAELLVLIAEHEAHHALSPEPGKHPKKAGLAQMDLIALTIMGRAITPTGAKRTKLQSIPFNTRAIATNVA